MKLGASSAPRAQRVVRSGVRRAARCSRGLDLADDARGSTDGYDRSRWRVRGYVHTYDEPTGRLAKYIVARWKKQKRARKM